MATASYAAYILHLLIVIGLQAGMEQIALPAVAKFALVALTGTVLAFGLGHLSRYVPGVRAILGTTPPKRSLTPRPPSAHLSASAPLKNFGHLPKRAARVPVQHRPEQSSEGPPPTRWKPLHPTSHPRAALRGLEIAGPAVGALADIALNHNVPGPFVLR